MGGEYLIWRGIYFVNDVACGKDLISSNSPSGGMKDIVLSESNFPSFTHWWNWQSSKVTVPAFALAVLFVWSRPLDFSFWGPSGEYPDEGRFSFRSKRRESFRPNRHSGVPERCARIMICPDTSALNAVPEINLSYGWSVTCCRH